MTVEEMKIRNTPKKVIEEELGGGYFFRCPWLSCNEIVKSTWRFCPLCGQRITFPNSDYEEEG